MTDTADTPRIPCPICNADPAQDTADDNCDRCGGFGWVAEEER